MKRRIFKSKTMNDICEQHRCSDSDTSKHAWLFEHKRWHSHPSAAFTAWFEPFEFDQTTGAHIGGHREASRIWSRKQPDGSHQRHRYGISTLNAWNISRITAEFTAWSQLGSPDQPQPFISLCAPLSTQRAFYDSLKLSLK